MVLLHTQNFIATIQLPLELQSCYDLISTFSSYEVEGFKMVLEGFEAGQKETPFLIISVKDYLWGYPSVLLTVKKHQKCKADNEDEWEDLWDDPCEHLLDENNLTKFGVFEGFNETSLDIRKINTGTFNVMKIL